MPNFANFTASIVTTFLLLGTAKADFASNAENRDFATPEIISELHRQIDATFEDKFRTVTDDIGGQSEINRAALSKLISSEPPESLLEAKRIAQSIATKLFVTHETKSSTAIKILESGSVLSLDELIRRGVVPLELKGKSSTRWGTDGFIGEQDVVFLGIKEWNFKKDLFGNVAFIFNKRRLLQKGYFTPFAFGMSNVFVSNTKSDFRGGNTKIDIEELRRDSHSLIPVYRSFLFKGRIAFNDLLLASILETKRFERRTLSSEENEILNAYAQSLTHDFQLDSDATKTLLTRILGKYRQDYKFAPNNKVDQAALLTSINFLRDRFSTEWNGALFKYLAAYQGFPSQAEGTAPLLTSAFPFWELKVPREVSLEDLEMIRIPSFESTWIKCEPNCAKGTNALQVRTPTTSLQQAVEKFARKRNLNFHMKRDGDALVYIFEAQRLLD